MRQRFAQNLDGGSTCCCLLLLSLSLHNKTFLSYAIVVVVVACVPCGAPLTRADIYNTANPSLLFPLGLFVFCVAFLFLFYFCCYFCCCFSRRALTLPTGTHTHTEEHTHICFVVALLLFLHVCFWPFFLCIASAFVFCLAVCLSVCVHVWPCVCVCECLTLFVCVFVFVFVCVFVCLQITFIGRFFLALAMFGFVFSPAEREKSINFYLIFMSVSHIHTAVPALPAYPGFLLLLPIPPYFSTSLLFCAFAMAANPILCHPLSGFVWVLHETVTETVMETAYWPRILSKNLLIITGFEATAR